MSFDSLLTHVVAVRRREVVGEDEHGQDETVESTIATVRASIQPQRWRELPRVSEAGPAIGTHVIYLRPLDVLTSDAVIHDPAACDASDDLPWGRYELVGTPAAAGLGHHLELDAVLTAAPELELAGS